MAWPSQEWLKHWGLVNLKVNALYRTATLVNRTSRALHLTSFMVAKVLFGRILWSSQTGHSSKFDPSDLQYGGGWPSFLYQTTRAMDKTSRWIEWFLGQFFRLCRARRRAILPPLRGTRPWQGESFCLRRGNTTASGFGLINKDAL